MSLNVSKGPKDIIKTIMGVIIASEWEDVEATEDVVAIDVLADDKIKYRVENTFLGNRLFFYLQQTVEIQGIVTIREDGSQSIEVRKYKIIDEK